MPRSAPGSAWSGWPASTSSLGLALADIIGRRCCSVAHGETWNGAPGRSGIRCEHSLLLAQIGAEYGLKPSLLMLTANTGRPRESIVGSGQLGTPRERMQWAKLRSWFDTCRTSGWGQ